MLHVTNGDAAAGLLRAAGFDGRVVPWRDMLHEGPVPAGQDARALRETRAEFLAAEGCGDRQSILEDLEERDRALDGDSEVVLWFEHDLYDQLQLIQILDRFASVGDRVERVQLVCIDRFPGVQRFLGLGQLTSDQVRTLAPMRVPVDDAHLALAVRAWAAFRDDDPRAIETVLAGETAPLPFLAAALRRHLRQLPSVRNGTGMTEAGILGALSAGRRTAAELFRAHQDAEPSPFLGDTTFFSYLRRMAGGPSPLVSIEDAGSFAASAVEITDAGRAVHGGELDAVKLNGIDRWWGGVHQAGHHVRWRFDDATSRLADLGEGD